MAVFKGQVRTKRVNSSSKQKWLNNTLKSSMSMNKTIIRNLVPSVYTAGQSLVEESKMMKETFNNSQNRTGLDAMLSSNPAIAQIKKGFGNIKEDLKSGNLNNTKRAESDDGFGGFGDLDWGLDDNSFDLPYNETESNSGGATAKIVNVNNTMDTDEITSALFKSANAISGNLNAVSKANYVTSMATIQAINKNTTEMTSGMRAMNDNLSMLVRFNSDTMVKYVDASLAYYNDSIDLLKKIERQGSMYTANNAPPGGRLSSYQQSQRNLSNGFNMQDFKKIMQGNKSNALASMGMGGMGSMMAMSLGDIVSNPLGFALSTLMGSMVPKNVRQSAGGFDKMFKNFGTGMMMKANGLKNRYDNPLLMALGELMGINVQRKTKMNLDNYNRGPIPFDGDTKRAIVDVIPTYLRKMLAAMTGDEEMVFDSRSSKFRSYSKAKKDIDDQKRNAELSGFSDVLSEMRKYTQDVQFESRRAQESFMEEMKNVFLEMSRNDDLVKMRRGNRDSFFDRNINDIATMNMNGENARLFKSIWANLPKATKANAAISGVTGGRNALTDLLNSWEQGGDGATLAAMMQMGKQSDFKPMKKGKGLLGSTPTDAFGNSQIDYLRNIQEILRGGIRTFSTKGKPSHLDKYKLKSAGGSASSNNSYSYDTLYMNGSKNTSEMSDDQLNSMMGGISASGKISQSPLLSKWANSNNKLLRGLAKTFNKPANMVSSGLDKMTDMMYGMLFGFGDDDDNDENSIMGKLSNGFTKSFEWIKTNVFEKFHNFLFDEEKGLFAKITKSQQWQTAKGYGTKGINAIFGTKNETGHRRGGFGSDFFNEVKDIFKGMSHQFTGKDYTNKDGKTVSMSDKSKSVFGEIKTAFKGISTAVTDRLFGNKKDKDGKEGILTSINEGLTNWKRVLFGKGKTDSTSDVDIKKSFASIKDKLPKTAAYGIMGAATGGLGGLTGALTGLFLPGGPIGGAIIGSGISFVTQSEAAKDFLFGKMDEKSQKRLGGVISADVGDFMSKNKSFIVGGAGIGALKGLILGNGFLPSLFFGAGPIGGAMMGVATSIAYKSKVVQDFLFGKADEEGNRNNTGFVKKLFGSMQNHGAVKNGEEDSLHLGTVGVGAVGGAAMSAMLGNFGVLGAMFTMGGSPIYGALMGAATGIAMASKNWRKYLFGEVGEDGNKKSEGIVGKFGNMFTVSVMEPIKQKIGDVKFDFESWFIKGITIPVEKMLDPIKGIVKNVTKKIGNFFSDKAGKAAKFTKKHLFDPIVTRMNTLIFKPLGKLVNNVFGMTTKLAGMLISAPFKFGAFIGDRISARQENRGLKEDFKNGKLSRAEMWREKFFPSEKGEEARLRYSGGDISTGMQGTLAKRERKANRKENWDKMHNGEMSLFEATRANFFSGDMKFNNMLSKFQGEGSEGTRAKLTALEEKKKERERQKQQLKFRQKYAKQMGYDSVDKAGKDISWIYGNNVDFSEGTDGKIVAKERANAKPLTETDTNVSGIKSDTEKIVENAGKIEGMLKEIINKMGFSSPMVDARLETAVTGSSNTKLKRYAKGQGSPLSIAGMKAVLDAEDVEDAADNKKQEEKKELELREKQVQGKDGQYQKEKMKKEEQEKEKKGIVARLLGAVETTAKETKLQGKQWGSIFGEKGILTLGILGVGTALLSFMNGGLMNLISNILGINTPKDEVEQNHSDIVNTNMNQRLTGGVFDIFKKNSLVKKAFGAVDKKMSTKMIDIADEIGGKGKYAQGGAKVSETVGKNADEVVETVTRRSVGQMITDPFKKGFEKITSLFTKLKDLFAKFLGKGNLTKMFDKIITMFKQCMTDPKIIAKYGSEFAERSMRCSAEAVASLGTLGLVDIGFAFMDAYRGLGRADVLFNIDNDNVTFVQRCISCLLEVVFGWGPWTALLDLFLIILEEFFGVDIKGDLALFIYDLIAKEEDSELVRQQQEDMKKQVAWYNETNGTSYTVDEYIDYKQQFALNAQTKTTEEIMNNKELSTWLNTEEGRKSKKTVDGTRFFKVENSTGASATSMSNSATDKENAKKRNDDFERQKAMAMNGGRLPEGYGMGGKKGRNNPFEKVFGFGPNATQKVTTKKYTMESVNSEVHDRTQLTESERASLLQDADKAKNTLLHSMKLFGESLGKNLGLIDNDKKTINAIEAFETGLTPFDQTLKMFDESKKLIDTTNGQIRNISDSYKTLGNTYSNNITSGAKTASNSILKTGSSLNLPFSSVRTNYGRGGFGLGGDDFQYYSQKDPKWAGKSYAAIDGAEPGIQQNISSRGCAPTGLAMIGSTLTGQNITPDAVARLGYDMGASVNGGTSWDSIPAMSAAMGVPSIPIGQNNIASELASGKPVLLSGADMGMGRSPYTASGHYVVAKGLRNGKVDILDPNGKSGNGLYDINSVAGQANAAWSFGMGMGRNGRKRYGYGPDDILNMAQNAVKQSGPSLGEKIVQSARRLIGLPYSQNYFNYKTNEVPPFCDCSSLCQWSYYQNGIEIGRTTFDQIKEGREIASQIANLKPGDLILNNFSGRGPEHVVLYAGNGKIIEASTYGKPCAEKDFRWSDNDGKWKARRILSDSDTVETGATGTSDSSSGTTSVPLTGMARLGKMSDIFTGVFNNVLFGEELKDIDFNTTSSTGTSSNGSTGATVSGAMGASNSRDGNALQHKDLRNKTQVTADELNKLIAKATGSNSTKTLNGKGDAIIAASNASGLDPIYIAAHAAEESAWGSSKICKDKNNFFGIGAFDSSPYASAYGYPDAVTGITEGAKWIAKNYTNKGQESLYKMRFNNGVHQYATNQDWASNIANIMATSFGGAFVPGGSGGGFGGKKGKIFGYGKPSKRRHGFGGDTSSAKAITGSTSYLDTNDAASVAVRQILSATNSYSTTDVLIARAIEVLLGIRTNTAGISSLGGNSFTTNNVVSNSTNGGLGGSPIVVNQQSTPKTTRNSQINSENRSRAMQIARGLAY